MRVRAALLDDWPLKLTSLALSVLLWLVASAEESASGLLKVAVQVQPPAGRSIVRGPEQLRATVVGPRRDLLKLATETLILTRLLPDTLTADSMQLDFAPADLVLPHGVNARVQDIEPRRVTVELDPVIQRMVTVRPIVVVEPGSGFELVGGVGVAPAQIRVTGPRDAVDRVDSVATLPLAVRRADGPSQERIAIDTGTLGPVRVVPARVTVSINVQASGERSLADVPVQLPVARLGRWRPSPALVTVRLHGPRSRLGALSADSIAVVLDPPLETGGRAALRLHLPAGIRGVVIPDTVSLVRRGERG